MRCIRSYFTISLYINQEEIYPLEKSIILDLGLNVDIIN